VDLGQQGGVVPEGSGLRRSTAKWTEGQLGEVAEGEVDLGQAGRSGVRASKAKWCKAKWT